MRTRQALLDAIVWLAVAAFVAIIFGLALGAPYALIAFVFVLIVYAIAHA